MRKPYWRRRNDIWLTKIRSKIKNKEDLIPYWKHRGTWIPPKKKTLSKIEMEDEGGLIPPWYIPSIVWLTQEIKFFKSDRNKYLLSDVLRARRDADTNATLYQKVKIPKPRGGYRTISIPNPKLLKVQKAINKYVLGRVPSHPNAFGFSGGNVVDAIKPHLGNKVLYSFDVVDAFNQVPPITVWEGLHYRLSFLRISSAIITQLGFWARTPEEFPEKLPQGSALSPRLFDVAFYPIDIRLNRLAQKFGGAYTRYADNIFISLPTDTFPQKLRSAVLRRMKWLDKEGTRIKCHKFSVRRLDKGAVRMLGLNIINGEIHATREYKRNLRLAIHHINYLINSGKYYTAETEWLQLQGKMSFAKLGALPNSLLKSYSELEKLLNSYIKLFDYDEIQPKSKERTKDT
jgi:hypothetical protein